jgi:nicotinamide-nucleotide amidase
MAENVTEAELTALGAEVGQALAGAGVMLATAESCTGGWVGRAITSVSGSANWYERGFITYSEAAKREMLGVSAEVLQQHGAVSEPTARAMAQGALAHSHAQVALAVTGIAGPTGGSEDKPVGMVWFAWAANGRPTQAVCHMLDGDRETIRRQSVAIALRGLLNVLTGGNVAKATG